MNNIKILSSLIKKNLNNNIKNVIPILKEYNGDDWKKYKLNTDKFSYNRNIIYQDTDFEIILITWGENSESQIHDHSKNGCAFKVLEGELTEQLYNTDLQNKKTTVYSVEDINYIDNSLGYHKILNNSILSNSIHIYSPPNYKCKNIFIK
jgi:hypothetical protein